MTLKSADKIEADLKLAHQEMRMEHTKLIDTIEKSKLQVRAWIVGATAVHFVLTVLFDILFGKG